MLSTAQKKKEEGGRPCLSASMEETSQLQLIVQMTV